MCKDFRPRAEKTVFGADFSAVTAKKTRKKRKFHVCGAKNG